MNTAWSTTTQSISTLYLTRHLRFDDRFSDLYKQSFSMRNGSSILELGCGPGALSESLRRWYPESDITGTDRDTNFIGFAKRNIKGVSFAEADINALPFADNFFDVTISHTIQEHVAPNNFFGEQYRVLKSGGVCLVLSSRRGINLLPEVLADISDFEKELQSRTQEYYKAADEKLGVCKYPMTESEIPQNMEKYGFGNVSTRYIPINLTPDSSSTDRKTALALFEANRQANLDSVDELSEIAPGVVTRQEADRWKGEINARFDRRAQLYEQGVKLWDTYVSIIMVTRGVK